MMRRLRSAAALALAVLVLAGCAGLPTGGPVTPGLSAGEEPGLPPVSFVANPPQPGATPQQIVDGFLAAGSDTADEWRVAREYLTEDFRSAWAPTGGVAVEEPGEREYAETDGAVTVTLATEATVDATGVYDAEGAGTATLPFRLQQDAAGEWRISDAPDGIVLDHDRFEVVFRAYSVMYYDPTWTFLVPDVRWFTTTNPATSIARALVDGAPAPWLAGAVATAVTESLALSAPTVPVQDGTAQVGLTAAVSELDQTALDRLQTQLEASLATAGVAAVQMSVAGQPLAAETVTTRSTMIQARALVLTEEGFGFVGSGGLEPLEALSDVVVGAAPTAVQLAPDQDQAAMRLADGTVRRAVPDGVAEVDARPGLIDPTIDPSGWIWTVPVASPREVRAYAADGSGMILTDAWTGAERIVAMQVSRDGARMAALVEDAGGTAVWVAGVARGADGVPTGLGEHRLVSRLAGDGVALAWLDATSIGIVSAVGDDVTVTQQPLDGRGDAATAPAGITTIAGTNQTSVMRLRDAAGVLYVRRGSTWGSTVDGIAVLATQQGQPR